MDTGVYLEKETYKNLLNVVMTVGRSVATLELVIRRILMLACTYRSGKVMHHTPNTKIPQKENQALRET